MSILARSLKGTTMNKPHIAILTLAALAVVSLAACSRPSSRVAQPSRASQHEVRRKARQKILGTYLSAPVKLPPL